MPAADYQLFAIDLRVPAEQDPALALGVFLDAVDAIHGNQRTAVDTH